MSKGLPLPPGFFRCPPLRDAEVQHLRAIADEACADTVANALAMAKLPPKKVVTHPRTKRHVQLHHGPDLRQPELDGITGVTRIATNYDELHGFYHLQTAKQVRTYSKVASQTLLDRVTLYTLERSSSPFRVTSIVWAAIETPILKLLPGAIAKRDTCYLEVLHSCLLYFSDDFPGFSLKH
ncbi:hypothetical protein SPRG_11751 [Saprolegnia parasitica CBS 223.65]|uniref:Uncharacterized protein n=1 Tax=Saprolegnia parasitica (strain CBS 223.65) TaxID=695850 RepID=A0A067C7W3_SAPPC|nr:hypothetical protein SPRG_11751 [Saprolegnia parasitica CBS 223.65]KDO22907.1 hypothetical protein SPRG_11751 [Saprolegnia parasitica CBS 223.65]|eukprot:XP_012206345.1 hypothetical protein SPRG_11751 [Saprolegnia parasitica CBS 223.65]